MEPFFLFEEARMIDYYTGVAIYTGKILIHFSFMDRTSTL